MPDGRGLMGGAGIMSMQPTSTGTSEQNIIGMCTSCPTYSGQVHTSVLSPKFHQVPNMDYHLHRIEHTNIKIPFKIVPSLLGVTERFVVS